MNFEPDFRTIITIGYYLVAITTVIYVILDNRPPLKTLSWILVLLLLPIFGLIFYFYFGHNFKKERLFEGKKQLDLARIRRITEEQALDKQFHKKLTSAASKEKVMKLIMRNNKSRLTSQNSLELLPNGSSTFQSILDSLKNAKHHIHFEYYIFEEGKVASEIKSILISKAKEGVVVRFIYDSVGSWDLSSSFIQELEDAGVKVQEFMRVRFHTFTSKINYRNHRKIVVVDGVTGFIGGINISDKYLENDPELGVSWHDTHLKIEGEAVKDLQLIFLTDWYFLSDEEIINEEQYFPQVKIEINNLIQVLASGPDTDYKGVMKAYFSAITSAEKSVHIISPYFIPNESVLTALKSAALGGVEVKIILPGKSDSRIVQYSSQSYFEELLEAGVQIFQYEKGFIHSKILVIDDLLSSIGSANMDFRSFEQNLEVNAIIYSESFAEKVDIIFTEDLSFSKEIHLSHWQLRNRRHRLLESLSRLLAPLL